MTHRILAVVIILLGVTLAPVVAQKSLENDQPQRYFEDGMSHFSRGYYGLARQLFGQSQVAAPLGFDILKSDAAFYEALSAANLENNDAQYLLESFIENYPQSTHVSHACFKIGEIIHDEGRLRIALRWYDKVVATDLDRETRLRYFYKAGYANYIEGDKAVASRLLVQAKDVPSKWWAPVNYYYAHIIYEDGKHMEALRAFQRLQNEPGFSNIVPYYIAQIYYMEGDYDKAIEYGSPLMDNATGVMRTDLARVLGDSWFARKEYAKAIPYSLIVVKESKTPRREDYYHLGLSYYLTGDYSNAATYLAQVTSGEDEMAQNAYYHLADCYIKLNDKKNARIAFEAANRYAFDLAIKEDAMFNYIKLSYELSFSPFNELINLFLQFIEDYPNSKHIDSAYEYLGQALLTTKNYRQALEAMERITHKNADVYRAMQRVAYYRGLELFTNLQFSEAVTMFDYSLKYGDYNRDTKMGALYWRGEARYRLGDHHNALADYNAFIQSPGSRNMKEFLTAHYNIGYVHFNMGNYSQAAVWFRQYIQLAQNQQNAMTADALNRLGDTFFLERDFANAMIYYERASRIEAGSADYAMYQIAISLGISRNHEGKITRLQQLIEKYPTSHFLDDAWYEMGRSYVALNNLNDAIRCYKTVRDRFPRSSFARKAMLQLGLVFYNSGDLDQSMVYYKRVVNEFPGTSEAEDALLGLRNIYMDQNDPDGYIRYTNQIGGFARVDDRQRDSLSYVAAERLYMAGNCERALPQLENYLINFPQGRFVLNAHFYKADCQFTAGNMDAALNSFEFVTGRGKSLFSEDALIRAGEIHFRKENFTKAYDFFKRLEEEADLVENRQEALIGQMRSLARLNNATVTIEATNRVLSNTRMAPEIIREARYVKAKSLVLLNRNSEAHELFKVLADNTSSSEGAEAKFRVAEFLFSNTNHKEAEQVVFDFVNKGTPHQYWLAKSFILLSDIYASRGEFFQAAQYLESLLENYTVTDDDIRSLASEKLAQYQAQASN